MGWGGYSSLGGRTKLILADLEIPHHQGLQEYPIPDALVHAICDARWARWEKEIRPPPSEPDQRFKNISSLKLLEDVVGKFGQRLSSWRMPIAPSLPRRPAEPAFGRDAKDDCRVLQIDPDLRNVKGRVVKG